jgi:SAM-dependent methyltransferase
MIGRIFNRRYQVGLGNSENRDAWVEKTLINMPAGNRLLDAGAGECQYRKFCSHLDYVSQDFSEYDGQGNNAGLQTDTWDTSKIDIVSDITSVPEPDESFDVILCTEVFEHIPSPALAIVEFSRLLKPGGTVIITAPFWSLTHFAPYHFATGFNRYFYHEHLNANGFKNVTISANGNYFDCVAQEVRRVRSMSHSHSSKPVGFFARAATAILIMSLNAMSKTDRGSDDLLCFGLHVVATKA